jgi:malonyl-CoA O-methyltransferase
VLTKTKIKQSFANASIAYDSVASLQRQVGETLLRQLGAIDPMDTVVDLGCGTGFLINNLLAQNNNTAGQVIALDIALPMLKAARNKQVSDCSVTYLCADAEYLPLTPQSVDLAISNLAFQWCGNLGQAFNDVKRILKPEGRFVFTTFGSNTLHELTHAWRQVDDYAHVNIFYDITQLNSFLKRAGFQQVELETRTYISAYESVWELMAELKQLGAHTVMAGCNKQFTSRSAMQRMINAYQQDENGEISATFEVISVMSRA